MNIPYDSAFALRKRYAASRQMSFLLLLCLLLCAALARAQATVTGAVTPASPKYIDPVMLQVTVAAGTAPAGNVQYSVDGGASSTAPVTNGVATISLGRYALGSHSVSYQFQGTPANSATQTASFTVADLPFSLLWTKQSIFDNHSGWGDGAPDASNNMLITNPGEGKLYRLDALHNLSVVATTGIAKPVGIATDVTGTAYIADSTNNDIVKLSASGQQTALTVAGLLTPTFLALDATATNLYINDSGHSRIVRYTLATGNLTEVVTSFDRIDGLGMDTAGRLYFGQRASYGPGGVFRVETNGNVTGPYFGVADPEMLHTDGLGNVYVVDGYDGLERFDTLGHRTWIDANYSAPIGIDRLNVAFSFGINGYTYPPGPVNVLAPNQIPGYGDPDTLVYSVPSGASVTSLDASNALGNVTAQQGGVGCGPFACSAAEYLVPAVPGLHSGTVTAKLSTGATLMTTFVGVGFNSNEAFDPGVQTSASTQLTGAGGMAEFEDGTLFVSDTTANKVYSLPSAGGAPVALNFTGLNGPTSVAVDGAKTVYVLDKGNDRVVALNAAGQQSTVYAAGSGALNTITALATDGSGVLYLGGVYGSTGPGLVRLDVAGHLQLMMKTAAPPAFITADGVGDFWEVEVSGSVLRKIVDHGFDAAATTTDAASGLQTVSAISADPSGTVFVAEGAAGTVLGVRPDGSTFNVYTGLGNAAAVVVDGRSVLHAIDGHSNTLLSDDRRTTVYAFGNQAVGVTSAPMVRTVSNDGNQVLAGIGSLPGDSTFQMVSGGAQACAAAVPDAGTKLSLGGFCTLAFTFTPASATAYNETGDETDSTPAPGIDYSTRPLTFTGTGVQGAVAALTPATLSFGSETTGSTTTAQTLTLTNSGTATLNIASIAASGSGFSISAKTCGATLAANSSCTISVVFAPTAASPVTGTVTVTDDATNGTTQTAALSGTGTAPVVSASLTPAAYNFGSAGVNEGTDFVTFVLQNTGTASLQVSSIALAGAKPDDYGFFMEHTCGQKTVLPAGASCNILISFQPQAAGPSSATLTVVDNAGTQTSALTGNGTAAPTTAAATLTPATQDFGSEAVGATSATQIFTLTNTGNVALNPQAIQLGGADVASFAITGGSCSTAAQLPAPTPNLRRAGRNGSVRPKVAVGAGNTCTVTVVFTPAHAGASTATLAITDEAGTQSSTLTGTSTTVSPAATLTPAAQDFGSETVGVASATETFTLSSTGTAPLNIGTVGIAGADASGFAITGGSCVPAQKAATVRRSIRGLSNTATAISPQAVASGSSCTVTVVFTPAHAGASTATLTIVDDAGTQSSALTGTGTAPAAPKAALTPGTGTFPAVTVNGSGATQAFTLTNAGNASLSITSATITGPNAGSFKLASSTCGSSLAAGATCAYSVAFVPTAVGTATATLTVVDAVGTQTAALSGTATPPPVPPDFTIAATPSAISGARGAAIVYGVQLQSADPANPFTNAVALSVSGLPQGASATFAPASVTPGTTQAALSHMTVTVPVLTAAVAPRHREVAWAWLLAPVGLLAGVWKRRRLPVRLLALLCAAGIATAMVGCGSGTGFGLPSATSTLTITGVSGSTIHTTTVTLTVR